MKLLSAIITIFTLSLMTLVLASCAKDEVETAGTIYGIVNDSDNSEPIQGAHVSLNPGGKTTNTGSDGRYEFSEMEPGQYTIQISKADYKTNTKRIVVVAGEQASGDMMLKRGESRIKLNTRSLNFGSQSTSKTFTVMNTGTAGTVSWSVSNSISWLSVTPASGSTAEGKSSTVVVNIDRSKITADISANILVEADGESLPIEIAVTKTGSGDPGTGEGGEGGGSCDKITSCDTKVKVEFTQCTKIGDAVEFQFKVTNTGDDVELKFDTSGPYVYDDAGNTYNYTKCEFYISDKRIVSGTSAVTFPKNVALQCKVKLPNISSKATYISRCDIKINSSKPWAVLVDKIMFEGVKW